MASKKTLVIEKLFFERFDAKTKMLSDPIVTLEQAEEAIRRWGKGRLSTRNPANFMKDIVRSPNRNKLFPESVVREGWTARQDPGSGRCFRFVPLDPEQETAFLTATPDPSLVANPHLVQTLSLPPASRPFGRPHETWLTHVVTNLGIVHTHFALNSPLDLIALDLLGSNVALGDAEVDAIYLATSIEGRQMLVSCEMKGMNEVLDEDQIERGSRQVAKTSRTLEVIPMGIKAIGGGMVWIVEFDPHLPPLAKLSESVFRLEPPVPGIG
ncbi:MAG TPA: hypothetical protein VFP17_05630 [Solirubrobacterales bacterium]|nr:hypothetical protein [Solirubrobacterales bacterium]